MNEMMLKLAALNEYLDSLEQELETANTDDACLSVLNKAIIADGVLNTI